MIEAYLHFIQLQNPQFMKKKFIIKLLFSARKLDLQITHKNWHMCDKLDLMLSRRRM